MNLQDSATLDTFMERVQETWGGTAAAGWIVQTDDHDGYRVLLASALDMTFETKRLRVFKVQMSGHQASPIYYVFARKGAGDGWSKTAHYILSHQRSLTWREWFCGTTQRSVPHLGTYRGDLALVGATFHRVCLA